MKATRRGFLSSIFIAPFVKILPKIPFNHTLVIDEAATLLGHQAGLTIDTIIYNWWVNQSDVYHPSGFIFSDGIDRNTLKKVKGPFKYYRFG